MLWRKAGKTTLQDCRHVVLLNSCNEFMYPLDPHGVKKWGGGYDPPSSYGCAAHGYSPRLLITEWWTKVGRRTASTGCWWSSEQSTAVWAVADAVRVLMTTSTQLSHCCWLRKTNLRTIEQSEKFHVRRGIHRSSVSRIIHKDLCLKCCKKRRAQQLDIIE